MMQGWYYVESLTGHRRDRVQTESQIATVDSCFDLVAELGLVRSFLLAARSRYSVFFLLSFVSRLWHWPICKNLGLSFIWGHHHLHLVGMDDQSSFDHFITCYTVLTRPNKVETAVHCCNSWLSVWTLSCRYPVKLSTRYQPCIIVFLY